ncbi:MAG: hypothetical protein ACRECO_15225 [Xanthobacteraceae bacterium]
MADQNKSPNITQLRKLEASIQLDLLERGASALGGGTRGRTTPTPAELGLDCWRLTFHRLWARWRRLTYIAATMAALVMIGVMALWWRLASGPIDFDLATPWLTSAIEENFGSEHRIAVGGAQIERDAAGRTALRIRDIIVRDAKGAIVASAPKAEVGLSSSSLLTGRVRAERLSLVGAEMQVRIEPDGRVTVFAGANKRPFVTASVAQSPVRAGIAAAPAVVEPSSSQPQAARAALPDFAALLGWIDGLGATGLDGHDLSELGLKNGNLTVDDRRNGKQWTFDDINLSLTRPRPGSIALTVSSESTDAPWMLRATVTRNERGHRVVEVVTHKLPAKDLLLALRIGQGRFEPDMPVSARIRAEIGPDGLPVMLDGRILMEKGFIIDLDEPLAKIAIDRAEFTLDWDSMRRMLVMPFQIISGGNRITLLAQLDAPRAGTGVWGLKIAGGTVVLASAANDPKPLILNRFLLRLRIDTDERRIAVEQGDIGNAEVGLAVSGGLDYSGDEPRLALGIAGTRMSVAAMKLLWPSFISPKVRAWVESHMIGGTVERVLIATNTTLASLKTVGPPIPEDGLAIEIAGNGAEILPVEGLPSIRDADVNVRITGRTAKVTVGRGNIEISQGRKLAISSGLFEVPDTYGDAPPARVRFRLDGPVSAAAELLNLPRLREFAGSPIDAATSRGTLVAHIVLGLPLKDDLPPGSTKYAMYLDVSNFAAERLVLGQKVEAATLRVRADTQGYQIKGDVKINGIPASLDYRKTRAEPEAEVRVQAILDERARTRLGYDLTGYVGGPMPVKIHGRVPLEGGESRYSVEADLTQARIDRLLPGWTKPAGRAARASFTVVNRTEAIRFEDIVIEGSGTSVRGMVEIDADGDVIAADLPVFNLSDGDKALLKAERGPEGVLRVMVRGEIYDGRGFIKSSMAGPVAAEKTKKKTPKQADMDIDVKVGTVAGHHGETLRGVDLRMSRRNGAIQSFALSAKLGRDTPIIGDLRGRAGGRNVIYVETKDAGAFFRFTDTYPKIYGGEMWVAMDPPTANQIPQDGILNIRNFTVRGEPALERVAAGAADPGAARGAPGPGVEFSRMRVEFTRSHGRIAIREGIVRGPVIGATAEGHIDYLREEVRMRGTFVPFFGLNNMFGQIPVFGIFLGGGSNEGLVGLTYEIVGTPGAPVLRVNPISVVAPGLMRKFFEFPTGAQPQSYAEPIR